MSHPSFSSHRRAALVRPDSRQGLAPRLPRAPRPSRAPALYVLGWDALGGSTPAEFRLPCPPALGAPLGVAAGERRVRKAYFATLEALRTGRVDPGAEVRLARLIGEVRTLGTRRALQQLQRAQRFIQREAAGWPVIAAPRAPLARVVVTVPSSPDEPASAGELARRHAWALEWLQMHRWVAGRGLLLEWRTAESAAPGAPAASGPLLERAA